MIAGAQSSSFEGSNDFIKVLECWISHVKAEIAQRRLRKPPKAIFSWSNAIHKLTSRRPFLETILAKQFVFCVLVFFSAPNALGTIIFEMKSVQPFPSKFPALKLLHTIHNRFRRGVKFEKNSFEVTFEAEIIAFSMYPLYSLFLDEKSIFKHFVNVVQIRRR